MKKITMLLALSLFAATPIMAGTHDAMSEGELRKVDTAGQRVTLRHGPINNLKMPPMTMVFRVQDAADLDGLSAGDKVKFRAEKEGGNYIVTELEKAE